MLGSDQYGRDVRAACCTAPASRSPSGSSGIDRRRPGAPIGLISGFYGGRVDALVMRVMDVLLAFPGILLALAIVSVLTPGSERDDRGGTLGGAGLRAARARERAVGTRAALRRGRARDRRARPRHPAPLHRADVVAPLIVTATSASAPRSCPRRR